MIIGHFHLFRYSFLFGDKDVFRFAALALNKPYYEILNLPTFVGYQDNEKHFFCGLIFVHKWIDGSFMFFHANNAKYRGMISKQMFSEMQTHENDKDLTITAQLTQSKGMGCTTYFKMNSSTTDVIQSKANQEINDFIDLWFGKIADTNGILQSLKK
eukprot:NODE_253_length_11722_cov_0.375118.p12 type:complete len:157 gc:universal NODE_253_length_11722_cov_0.375118:542-72(-)